MHAGNDAILLVRADLSERLESLRAQSRRASARDFTDAVETIRRIAAAYGLVPVARLAEALGHAAADGPACPRALYLSRLQDAIGCERMDEAASEAMLASVSVRLCG
ncbi:MAG: hypothetical protein QOH86_1144 [Sphingomonadales bacterium]|jgi:hypothetical protein|nr:hypothetical protein [Sphingomonadales bacterium]